MKILVTGGAGFIGSAVIRHLVSLDYEIVCVDKMTYASSLDSINSVLDNPLFYMENKDICDVKAMSTIFKNHKPDKVLHLAAETHVDRSIDSPDAFVQSNIIGTYTLIQTALDYWNELNNKRKSLFRFHHVSTDEVFGDLEIKDPPFCEDTPYDPSSPYSASKASSDHIVMSWHRTYKLPILLSNCSNNYGPFQFPEKLIPMTIIKAIQGQNIPVYGQGDQIRDWLYVDDHITALVKILNEGVVGESYNVGGNCEKTNIEVVSTICNILDNLIPKRPNGISSFADLISFVEDRPGHDKRYAINANKIKQKLNWEPSETLETGMHKTITWYLENQEWLDNIINTKYQGNRLGLKI